MAKISVVINTLNEEKNIERAIKSVQWADEILVCDMHSDDDTAVIAKKLGAKVIFHKRTGYVEPARNFAISKAEGDWIFILDADEECPEPLAKRLQEMVSKNIVSTFVEIPRKNLIFDKWVKSSGWWPDYNIRFFKKGAVTWNNQIHRPPKTEGQGIKLPEEERWAIIHYHYTSVEQFIERLNRYSGIQAKELRDKGIDFTWTDLIQKPLREFLSRFFAQRGFEDGVHGLVLAFLQAFSELVVYLKLWEMQGFKEGSLKWDEITEQSIKGGEEINYWLKYGNLSKNPLKRALQKAKNKLS